VSTTIPVLRWSLKKASRVAVARSSRLLQEATRTARQSTDGPARVLTYHRFGVTPRDPFCVAPRDFAQHMNYLARTGLAISLDQLRGFVRERCAVPHDSVMVTIDDGFRSVLDQAMPILRDNAIPAVAFVSGDLIGSKRRTAGADADPEDYLHWRDLEALALAGISIQSHGCSHRSLRYLSRQQAADELGRSRKQLQERLGSEVAAFAYPFGTRADFDATIATMAGEAGYELAFTSQHGPIRGGDDALTLPRIKVESGESLSTFVSLVHGGLDAWGWIDRNLWRIQASRRAA